MLLKRIQIAFFGIGIVFSCIPRSALSATSVRCDIDPARSLVQFTSQAPFETVIGHTRSIRGWIEVQTEIKNPIKGEVIVDAASLKTGNRLRDKDMVRKFLETEQYPEIRFTMTEGKAGNFSLHGVQRMETVPMILTQKEEGLNVTASFSLKLSDYQIERPAFLWMRLSEMVDITVDLSCSPRRRQSTP